MSVKTLSCVEKVSTLAQMRESIWQSKLQVPEICSQRERKWYDINMCAMNFEFYIIFLSGFLMSSTSIAFLFFPYINTINLCFICAMLTSDFYHKKI